MVRPGNTDKFVEQSKNLFIILNEEGKVGVWHLTKTTTFDWLRGVFLRYKTCLQRANKKLELNRISAYGLLTTVNLVRTVLLVNSAIVLYMNY